jgi:hypothetical protein
MMASEFGPALPRPEQNASDRESLACRHAQQIVGDIGGVEIWHHQHIGWSLEVGIGKLVSSTDRDSAASSRISPSTARSGDRS